MSELALLGGTPVIPAGFVKSSPPITELDEKMVLASLHGDSHAWEPNCDKLQEEFAAWNGQKYCLAVGSGTAALHMALAGVGVGAGDEVITPAYSWTSSVSCVLHQNAIPVFVDIDPVYANLDPTKLEAAITPRTKAIIVVHLHGVPAQMDEIMAIANRHGLPVVEDCCQSHGALYRGKKVGTMGAVAAFSLNQNKMFSAGEGGLLTTDNEEILERARSLELFGDFRRPEGDVAGFPGYGLAWQYRYNDLCAAWARAQLTQLDGVIDIARGLFQRLRAGLAGIPGLVVAQEPEYARENGYNFLLHVDPEGVGYAGPADWLREAVSQALAAEGVPGGVWQRRILPEMAAIAAKNAYGNGSPWREAGSAVTYNAADFPASLYHSATYYIIGALRAPNDERLADMIVTAMKKVFAHIDELDVEGLAKNADVSLYERGWRGRKIEL